MVRLPTSQPAVYNELRIGGSWTLQRSDCSPFSSIAGDQAIEQTVNRDTKTTGGLKGITLKRGVFFSYPSVVIKSKNDNTG